MDKGNCRPSEYYTNRLVFLRNLMRSEGYGLIARVRVEIALEKNSQAFGRVEMETVNEVSDTDAVMRFAVPQPNGPLSSEEIEEVRTHCINLGLHCDEKNTQNEHILEFRR